MLEDQLSDCFVMVPQELQKERRDLHRGQPPSIVHEDESLDQHKPHRRLQHGEAFAQQVHQLEWDGLSLLWVAFGHL